MMTTELSAAHARRSAGTIIDVHVIAVASAATTESIYLAAAIIIASSRVITAAHCRSATVSNARRTCHRSIQQAAANSLDRFHLCIYDTHMGGKCRVASLAMLPRLPNFPQADKILNWLLAYPMFDKYLLHLDYANTRLTRIK